MRNVPSKKSIIKDKYLEQDETYRKARAENGGKNPFCPESQTHFELDFLSLFGSAFSNGIIQTDSKRRTYFGCCGFSTSTTLLGRR